MLCKPWLMKKKKLAPHWEQRLALDTPRIGGTALGADFMTLTKISDKEGSAKEFIEALQTAPVGTLWIFFQTAVAVDMWFGHTGLALRKSDGSIGLWHLDGADNGEDETKKDRIQKSWMKGKGLYEFGQDPKDLLKEMDFTDAGQQMLMWPLFLTSEHDLQIAAEEFKTVNPNYHYCDCNCSLFVVSVINTLMRRFNHGRQLETDQYMVPKAASTVGDIARMVSNPVSERLTIAQGFGGGGDKNKDGHACWSQARWSDVPSAAQVPQSNRRVVSLQAD
jgi:hypothetical protein